MKQLYTPHRSLEIPSGWIYILGDVQKSGVLPGPRISRQENPTCTSCDLEIKTDKFLFFVKQCDNLLFVYLSSFGVFCNSDRNTD